MLITNYSKDTKYKVNMQNSITFKNTSNKLVEFEVKNATYISSTKMKNSGINLTKICQRYTYMRKTKQTKKLMKEIKD